MDSRPAHRLSPWRLLVLVIGVSLASFSPTDLRTKGTVSFDNIGLYGE